jgi:hypothetical protein
MLKAVFCVKSFEGDSARQNIRFYANGPVVERIWVEIQFRTKEVIEGTLHNSLRHLVDNGFFLQPSDPESNNILVYIDKSSIMNYRVLGVRAVTIL